MVDINVKEEDKITENKKKNFRTSESRRRYMRNYQNTRYRSDPEYRKYKLCNSKRYYHKMKEVYMDYKERYRDL